MGIHHADRDFCRDPEERGTLVLMEVLTRRFKGMIVCDGWKPYAKFTNRIRAYARAHLLRESKDLAEKIAEAVSLHRALTRLYEKLTTRLDCDPPPKIREKLLHNAGKQRSNDGSIEDTEVRRWKNSSAR